MEMGLILLDTRLALTVELHPGAVFVEEWSPCQVHGGKRERTVAGEQNLRMVASRIACIVANLGKLTISALALCSVGSYVFTCYVSRLASQPSPARITRVARELARLYGVNIPVL